MTSSSTRPLSVLMLAVVLIFLLGTPSIWAQAVLSDVERLEFDRPEAWAMSYFNSISLFTSIGVPNHRDPWEVEVGFEADWIPHLDTRQRTIGYNGIKEEDLNKLPVFVRPRVAVGLPRGWTLEVAWAPPIEINGVTSNLFALGIERPIYQGRSSIFGIRIFGQIGEVEGDFTCSDEIARHPPGSSQNPFGCEAASEDTVTLNHLGLELRAGVRLSAITTLQFGVAATYMDMEFQVDALTFGLRDRSLLLADGWTYSASGGASWTLSERITLGADLFYSPLDVVRPPADTSENDPLFTLRTLLRYRFARSP